MLGQIVSHYKVLQRVGEGGMGVLYLAEDIDINRKAVLKFLPPDLINDTDINFRFKREAQAAGSLSHPNIVTIYDVGIHNNKTFIAMEYVEGKTLRDLIKSDELTTERIIDISLQICEGLSEAHSKGIVHRDIKPENILIDGKGKVKIVDFGLAKINNVSREITRQGSTVGTIKYMAPEQIKNHKVDQRTDIWSFGIMLYEMITGIYPFKGEHDAGLFYSIINQHPEPLARYKVNVGEGFQRIIDKTLDKDPETRYQIIDEVLSDLKRERKLSSGSVIISNETVKKRAGFRQKSYLVASIILIIILSSIAVIYFINSRPVITNSPKHTQLTFDGNIYYFKGNSGYDRAQISPDGQFVAYFIDKKEQKSMYVQDISSGQSIEIFNGSIRSVTSLRWSSDSKKIFFSVIYNNTSSASYIISRLGGRTQELRHLSFGCWSPNDRYIAGIDNERIIIVNSETNEVVNSITPPEDSVWLAEADWSPREDKILFLSQYFNGPTSIWSIKADGTEKEKIIETDEDLFSPRWSADGKHIYYMRSNKYSGYKTQDLMKIEIPFSSNEEPEVIQSGLQAAGFSLTNDDRELCYTKVISFQNLWCFTFDKSKNSFLSKKLTEGTSWFAHPKISPDGKEIIYVQDIPSAVIYKMNLISNDVKQLTFRKSGCYNPKWSPDGNKISFSSDGSFYIIPTQGGTPTIVRNTDTDLSSEHQWLLDSLIFYNKADHHNFYKINLNSYENKQVLPTDFQGQISSPCLSPDKSCIAVFQSGSSSDGLWIISLKDYSNRLVASGRRYPLVWSMDGKTIYVHNVDRLPYEILKLNVSSGSSELVYTLPYSNMIEPDISADGKTIVAAIREINTDIWMIENFDPDVE